MKHIIFLKGTLTQEDVEEISDALSQTRAIYTVSMISNSVSVEGSNDVLHHAKQVISGLGYTIQ